MPVRRFAARILLGCASGYVACNYYGPEDLPGYGGGGQNSSGAPGMGGESSGGIGVSAGSSGAPPTESGGAGGFLNNEGGSAGGDAGGQSGGSVAEEGGAPSAGGAASGGSAAGGSAGASGGTAGNAGSTAAGGTTPCSPSSSTWPETVGFENDSRIRNTYTPGPSNWRGFWVRSTYDSTSNGNPPTDPLDTENLAARTNSGFEPGVGTGSPRGSMKLSIGFNGTDKEYLGVVFPFELEGSSTMLADLSGRTMTAQIQLGADNQRKNCEFSAAAFSRSVPRGANASLKVVGEHVGLENAVWKTVSFDLDLSSEKTRVMEVGIEIAADCVAPIQGPTMQTPVYVDFVSLACDATTGSSFR